MDRVGLPDWHYKQEAIQQVASKFSQCWKWGDLHQQYRAALIPIPPSRGRSDPMFDPRMLDMLTLMAEQIGLQLDIRDCLSFSGAFEASHTSVDRPTPDILYDELSFSPSAGRPSEPPGVIFLFDDVLTTGAHYAAATRRLAEAFPGVPVIGNFIARRRIP
jgi:predicted amidophosphoribosyltransferase